MNNDHDFYPTDYIKLGEVNEAQLRQIVRAVARLESYLCTWNAMHKNEALRRIYLSKFYNKDSNLHMTLCIQEVTYEGKKEVERKDYIIDGKTILQRQEEEITRLVLDYKLRGHDIVEIQKLMREKDKYNLSELRISEIVEKNKDVV